MKKIKLAKEEDRDQRTLAKQYKRLEIFMIVFMSAVICFGTFYFNVICFGTECENKSPAPLVIIKASKSNTNVEEKTGESSTDVSVGDLKEIFEKVYAVRTSGNPYCGKAERSDKAQPNGVLNYYVSTTYTSYNDMVNKLTKYATKEVLKLQEERYIVEDGKLYCYNDGKGSMCVPTNYTLEITNKGENEITAKVVVQQTCGNPEETTIHNEDFVVKYTKNENNWIISEYTQTNY